MKRQVIKIHDDESINILAARVRFFAEQGEQLEVEIRDRKIDYTARQRQTYFMWVGEIGKVTGEEKDELHLRLKRQFLVPIYRRDDVEYEAMIQAVIATKDKSLGRGVVKLTSITTASRAQMSEFMDCVQRHAHRDIGVYLTMPEDLQDVC